MAAKKSEEQFVWVALSSSKSDINTRSGEEFRKWGYDGRMWRSGTKRYLPYSFVQRLMGEGYPFCEVTPDMPDAKWSPPLPPKKATHQDRMAARIEREKAYASEPKVTVVADHAVGGLGLYSDIFFTLGFPCDWEAHEARELPVSLWQAISKSGNPNAGGLRLAKEGEAHLVQRAMTLIINPWREKNKHGQNYLAWMGAPRTAEEKEKQRQERIAQIKKELPSYEAHPNTYSRKLEAELAQLEGDA